MVCFQLWILVQKPIHVSVRIGYLTMVVPYWMFCILLGLSGLILGQDQSFVVTAPTAGQTIQAGTDFVIQVLSLQEA